MPFKGLTKAQIGRISGLALSQQAIFQRVTGGGNGKRTWGDDKLCNARIDPNSGVDRRPDGSSQAFDASVVIRTEDQLDAPGASWRCKVIEPKAPREMTDSEGAPEVKRTTYYRVVGVHRTQTQDGGDFLSLVRLASDATEPPW